MWQGKGDMSALSLGNGGFKETSVYLLTCLSVYLSTCRPVYGSLILKHLSSRQGESERVLLCKMWQGKGHMPALSTGNWGFKETSVYLSTCRPVYPSTCLPIYMSTCRPIYMSTCLPICMSTCRPVYRFTVPYF